jgi:hypothetical protein
MTATLDDIRAHLHRLEAFDVTATLDDEFEPQAGELVRVEMKDAYWRLLPRDFLALLEELPDGIGSEPIRMSIEQNATVVWHGPAPKDSRDESP